MSEKQSKSFRGGKREGAGRKSGIPNRHTVAAKDAIAAAAEGLGGVPRLIAWAGEDPLNERVFWGTIYPKLLPLQVNSQVAVSGGLVLVPAKNAG